MQERQCSIESCVIQLKVVVQYDHHSVQKQGVSLKPSYTRPKHILTDSSFNIKYDLLTGYCTEIMVDFFLHKSYYRGYLVIIFLNRWILHHR